MIDKRTLSDDCEAFTLKVRILILELNKAYLTLCFNLFPVIIISDKHKIEVITTINNKLIKLKEVI